MLYSQMKRCTRGRELHNNGRCLFVLVVVLFSQAAQVAPQSPFDYLYIDCGLPRNQSYADNIIRLTYISDDQFVETGKTYDNLRSSTDPSIPKQYSSLRSFPSGTRNCYTLAPTSQSNKYLLRLGFLYQNYDDLNSATAGNPISFDLYIGVNFWRTVNITDASQQYQYELITVASDDFISICLVDTEHGTPFISIIEMRHIKQTIYPASTSSQSLNLDKRYYLADNSTNTIIRYPDDPYDRIWGPQLGDQWRPWNNNAKISTSSGDMFEVPSKVLVHAATNHTNDNLPIHFMLEYPRIDERYLFLHFAEIERINIGTRIFDIHVNNITLVRNFTPPFRMSAAVYTPEPSAVLTFEVLIEATSNSQYGPLLNALEVYSVVRETEVTTLHEDFGAITEIKKNYTVKKNWMGDPCSPKNYSWDGVICNYTSGTPPIIFSLDLSSSGLNGSISDSFSLLRSIQILDLSNNQLIGDVPESLANISSLQVLNLAGNCLNKIPSLLNQKVVNGTLKLRFDAQTRCRTPRISKKIFIVVTAVVPSVIIMSMLVGLIICMRKRKLGVRLPSKNQEISIQIVARQFMYSELKSLTNDFERVIGKGGFGTVYYGKQNDGTEIAVKLCHDSSSEGVREFLREADHFVRTRHRYLVKMIGYCNDAKSVALVFEYMSEGTLQEHLRGEASHSNPLGWRKRLQIALESALGLEYLHKGCSPPIVHRDVKTNNILLDASLEAKIADFGISKAFADNAKTHETTRVIGTRGYFDPAYYNSSMLTEKSDVYSFGVVLLEIITGQPPVITIKDDEAVHISDWVEKTLYEETITDTIDISMQEESVQNASPEGNISKVVDKAMPGQYKIKSMKKAIELALQCVTRESAPRPNMSEVVLKLKKCIKLENADARSRSSSLISSDKDSMEVPLTSEQII